MKKTLLIFLALAFVLSCSEPKKPDVVEAKKYPLDTSNFFIRRILNCSPKEVSLKLGDSDDGIKKSKDCDNLSSCSEATYKNGEFEVLYHNSKLKWVQFNEIGILDERAIEYIGFGKLTPSQIADNDMGIWWRGIKGLEDVCAFPKSGYILIRVKEDYDKKF